MLRHEHTVHCRTSTDLRRQLALLEATFATAADADGLPLAGAIDARVWLDDDTGDVVIELQEASA